MRLFPAIRVRENPMMMTLQEFKILKRILGNIIFQKNITLLKIINEFMLDGKNIYLD